MFSVTSYGLIIITNQGTEIRTGHSYCIVGTVRIIIYQSSKIRTGPLYYSIVGTVIIIYQGTEIRTGPLYYSIVGTVIIKAVGLELATILYIGVAHGRAGPAMAGSVIIYSTTSPSVSVALRRIGATRPQVNGRFAALLLTLSTM